MRQRLKLRIGEMTDQILELMEQIPSTTYNPQIKDEDGTVLYDGFTVLHVMELWYDWFLDCREHGTDESYKIFLGRWDHYNNHHLKDLLKLYHTTYGAYDPLSNYDMMEQELTGRRQDDVTDTTTPHGQVDVTTTTDGILTDTVNTYKTGLGSGGTETLTDKIVNESTSGDSDGNNQRATTTSTTYGEDTDTERKTTYGNTQSGDFDGSTKTGYHEVTEHYTKRKGNIGVQSGQDLIIKEIEVRKHDILVEYIREFMSLYAYYTGSVS